MSDRSRRGFMQGMALTGGLLLCARAADAGAAPSTAPSTAPLTEQSPQVLPPLPFAPEALEPVISARTVDFHYNKHHAGYFANLAKLVAGTEMASASLEKLILDTAGNTAKVAVFDNAAQAWNHNLYWQSLSPAATTPSAALQAAVQRDFGGMAALKAELSKAAVGQFGSGWAWLVLDQGKLGVLSTSNADNPMVRGMVPLIVIDVWEHAYYLDMQNRRADHVAAVVGSMLNWDTASMRFERAVA